MTAKAPLIVAIDGPSAAGKGTLARRIAAFYGLAHLDSGLLYRAVGARLLAAGQDPQDVAAATAAAREVGFAELDSGVLREEKVAQAASKVAAIPGVREGLLDLQRRFAAAPPPGFKGTILDGRDIGTVVCPDAGIKLFITASTAARAERRHRELLGRGRESIYARVLQDMTERDARDRGRAISPLIPAADAIVIDTSSLDADATFALALDLIERRRQASGGF
jgi:CMP/dCMP kinase